MRPSKDEASTSTDLVNILFRSRVEPVLDLIAGVKGLHELSPQQLTKLIRDSTNNIVQHIAEDGSHVQIDVEKFARYLPLHLIAVIMAWERDKSTFKYLLCGIILLHALCDLASRVPKIEQILLNDVKVSEQIIDLVFYLLVVLGADKQEPQHTLNDMVLLHSALVACSLKLVTVIFSTQYHDVAQVLTAYYKVDIFMDATFSAVHKNVMFLQTKLLSISGSSSNTLPTAEETLNHLCQQCDSSLQFLQCLCQQKLFRERLVKNKELCGNGGVLVLAESVMNLKISPSYDATSSYITSVARLKSRALSILLHLCEAESVSYLDEVANTPTSQNLAKSIALQVLELLKQMFGIDSNQLMSSSTRVDFKGQLELNAMRLADVFSDDSNFRSFIMTNFAEALAAIFLFSHGDFLSNWCSSDLPVCEDDSTLDIPRESYAHERTSLLIKMIANLHCFVPDVCQDEKDLFLNKFVRFFEKEPQNQSDGFSSTFDAEKTTTISKNLRSLLSHAESLVPKYLNEDDVQLLRLFISQFESKTVPASLEDNQGQNAQNSGVPSSPLQKEASSAHQDNDETNTRETNIFSQEVDRLDAETNENEQSNNEEMKCNLMGPSVTTSIGSREIERDSRIVETSGSDSSSTRVKNPTDIDHIKGSGCEENQEDEKVDPMHSDEKLQRKRKRTCMNDKQIAMIESAILDEPDMHRNSVALRLWSDKLSLHGAEVTTSRLKNWLNNRKAKLARITKDTTPRAPNKPDSLNLDKQTSLPLNSPHSPTDDSNAPPPPQQQQQPSGRDETLNNETPSIVSTDKQHSVATSLASSSKDVKTFFETGQYVLIRGENGEEVGKGKVCQSSGNWCGHPLEKSGMCVVDIIVLSVDKHTKVLYPNDYVGTTFDEAQKRRGEMRVLWDLNKVFAIPT